LPRPLLSRLSLLVALALGTLAPLPGLAQGDVPAGTDTFEGATSVLVVEVPVQVLDRDGNPVRGLTRENFEIEDGRQKRDVLYFDVFDIASTSPAEQRNIAPAARRHFLLLFDLSFANPGAILRAREAAEGILDQLHPTDLVAVGTVSVTRGAQLVLAFTPDRKAAELAIETLGAPQLVDGGTEPLGVALRVLGEGGSGTSSLSERPTIFGTEASEGRGGAAGGVQAAIEDYVRGVVDTVARQDRESQANRIQGMSRAMADLAGLMRSVDGRKYVVYLSEGFSGRLLTGETGRDSDSLRDQRTAIETGTVWDVDTTQMFGDGRLQNTLEAMLEEFRRADCAIHSVDIGGLRAPGEGPAVPGGQEGLVAMARGTGGEMYQNFNDLGEAMGRMLESTGVTYVLAFQPEDLEADGSYRKLRVRLKDAPRGARIVHRPGYFAPLPAGQRVSAQEQRLSVGSQLLTGRVGGDLGVEVLAIPFAAPDGRPALPVLIEIGGAELAATLPRDDQAASQAALEIYAYALDSEGGVADSFFQTLGLDLGQVGEKLRQGGVKFYGQLNPPPGVYNLRVLVRNPVSGASGLASVGVEVPDFSSGELTVLSPLVPEMDLERWLMVRQAAPGPGTEGERQLLPYPFILGEGQSFIPAAVPVVRGSKAVNLGLFAYHVGLGEPVLNAQVLDSAGNVVLGQQLPVLERRGGGEGEPTRLLSALQLPGVPPGEYTLSVALVERSEGGGGRRGLATLPIRVEPGLPGEPVATLPGAGLPAGAPGAIPGAVPDDDAAGAQALELSGRSSQRFPVLKGAYQRALAQLSAGEEVAARDALLALEEAEREISDDVRMGVLHEAEMDAARQLASRNPDALIPVMLLHEATYHACRERGRSLLALHNRTMVRELAELYVQEGGSPTSLAANVFTSLGGSLQQAGLTRAANALFERALDLRKNDQGALLSLAVYYEKIGDYAQAVRFLERLVEAHPQSPEGWLRLGINLGRRGKEAEAEEWLRRAAGPEAPAWVRSLAFQERARAALGEGHPEEAERLLSAGADAVPGDQHLLLQLVHVLDRQGKQAAARAVLEGLEPVPPGLEDSPRYRYNRWPIHVLETGRRELRETAVERLPLLAGVIRAMPESEWSR